MDDGIGQDIATAIDAVGVRLERQNELQEDANTLMRSLISALEATSQELLELRQHLHKSDN